MPKNWSAEEHTKLLVAIIKTGKPKVDTTQIATYLNNGRTAGAVYFEIRRLKMLAEGGITPVKKRPRDSQPPSPGLTPAKTEPRPLRATRPSKAKRQYDEVAVSGFWDESDGENLESPVKRPKGKVKSENEFQLDGGLSGSDVCIGA